MDNLTPISAIVGGSLIGISATLLMLWLGRVAGISGIVAGLLKQRSSEFNWRLAFVLGLIVGGGVSFLVAPQQLAFTIDRSLPAILIGGVLVGYGARLASGCTSGHGVCGVSRLSRRSLVAVPTFVFFAALTVFVINSVFGGQA